MFNQIGPLEIGLVLLIVLVIFGPKRLPGLGKQLGTGMREFKESITGKDGDRGDDDDASDERPALTDAPPVPPAATQPVPDAAESSPAGSRPAPDQRT
jgi:sec-independent protein translocase protein TatA